MPGGERAKHVLLSVDRSDDHLTEATLPTPPTLSVVAEERVAARGGRYGETRKLSLPALVLAVAIPALAVAGLLQTGNELPARKAQPRLVVVDLSPPPPPPPAKAPPPQPVALKAPVPLLRLPDPTPQPLPAVQPVPVAIPVTLPAPPPAVPARAAPPSSVKADDLGTRMISAVPPRYPTESRRSHEQGTVVLGLTLDLNGRVADISIVHSSGYRRLDEAALRAVRKWRWAPTLRDGQPVIVRGQVEIPFILTT
jgi:protein TonB